MPDEASTPPSRAVFLSYPREDTDAARRIADALRAFGLEVWFDQSELRGGDAWDTKIKRQIRECALFLPIISAQTQSRLEGYFRREWKLGVERTHDMAGGVAFILPVVIDDTPESAALVPEEFMRYQWTRLPHGVPTPEFVGQVKRLLEAPRQAAPAPGRGRSAAPISASGSHETQRKSVPPGWSWGVLAAVVIGVAVAIYLARKPAATPPAPVAVAESKPAAVAAPAPDDKSIAVLPFDNMSEEKDASAFFADGVQEDILTNLSFIKDLRVISRTSVMQYRGTTKPIREIAQELGVAYILEGSVRRAGSKVRVTGQLIRASMDEHVWAKAYDRDITDVFAIQAELAQAIAAALQAAISPAEKSLLERKPTNNPAAYDLYLKARGMYQGNSIDFAGQTSSLLDAVQLDPNFAEAWAVLGATHANAYFSGVDRSEARLAKAKAAIDTAVRIAPDDPVVIEMQGDYFYYGYRDYTHAAEQYQRLLTLRPNSSEAYGSLGLIYRRQGHWADATTNFRKSLELDQHNVRYRTAFSAQLLGMRHFEESAAEMHRAVQVTDGYEVWRFFEVITSFFSSGSTVETEAYVSQLKASSANDPLAINFRKFWARLHGDYAEALRLDGQQQYFDIDGTPHWQQDLNAAFDYIGNGDMPTARARLEKLLPDLKAALVKEPSNTYLWAAVGLSEAVLGDRSDALAAASKATELLPESIDAVDGPGVSESRAKILAWAGDKDQAISEVARLLHTPYGANIYVERFDPGWIPLRDDPRFQALVADPKNNEPIL